MIRLRRTISSRSNIGVAAALAVTCLAFVWAHSGMAADHMGHEASSVSSPMISACVAVLEAVGGLGLALAARRWARERRGRHRSAASAAPFGVLSSQVQVLPLARAGPTLFGVFKR